MPTMPRREIPLLFDADGYPGFVANGWVSAPLKFTDELFGSKDETHVRELMLEAFPEWNFCDEAGNEIPHAIESFELIPKELIMSMLKRYQLAISTLPQDFGMASRATSTPAS